VQHRVPLPALNYNSLPYHPNYFLGALAGSPCDTLSGADNPNIHDFNFRVYPNPSKKKFQILNQLPQNYSGLLEILDINGNLILSRHLPALSTIQKNKY